MSHKADASFFDFKRPWSKHKDQVLDDYLKPYLAKISTLGKPILIVDGFAGPGQFSDGNRGSPLIICHAVQEHLSTAANPPKVQVLCIEEDAKLFARLETCLESFVAFARCQNGTFLDALAYIKSQAQQHCSIFLFADPFTVAGLDWAAMDAVFSHIQNRTSIELLLNLNASSFVRIAWAVAGRNAVSSLSTSSPEAEVDATLIELPTILRLDGVAGGQWWHKPVLECDDFPEAVNQFVMGYCDKLRVRFKEVCHYNVMEHWNDSVPKYSLVFASRHPDALKLINDSMVKIRKTYAEQAAPDGPTLFETRPTNLVPDKGELQQLILQLAAKPILRKDVVLSLMRSHFCLFSASDICRCIREMLLSGVLKSEDGRTRIGDTTRIQRAVR